MVFLDFKFKTRELDNPKKKKKDNGNALLKQPTSEF